MTPVKTLGRYAFRSSVVRRAAFTAGAIRGHRLVLVFHRITADGDARPALVPSMPASLLRQQIGALLQTGEIVGLEDLIRSEPYRVRPRFALTFDDDWITHSQRALPILQDLGVSATFFLSGRSLHQLGPLWFERLDRMVAERGIRAAAGWLGVNTDDPERLANICENQPSLQERLEEASAQEIHRLGTAEIGALAKAGMTIGFHTLHHPLLSRLPDAAVDEALVLGRRELEDAAGQPVRFFAYPHGKADARAAARLPALGFVAACTGRPLPVRPGHDPFLVGRWEPGPIRRERFMASLAVRLNGWSSS